MFGFYGIVMAGLDPAIPLTKARPCHIVGIAGSNPAMTAGGFTSFEHAADRRTRVGAGPAVRRVAEDPQ
jgi:hypothetical protein